MGSYLLIGIGGCGTSALARILLDQGFVVRGIDLKQSVTTDMLQRKGAKIEYGDNTSLEDRPTVVVSTAISSNHPILLDAKRLGLSILHRSALLSLLMRKQKPLLVAGTHGKTSTSGLLAFLLHHAGQSPSYAIGGDLLNFEKNGEAGNGEYFVAEADESDGSFLNYTGYGAIITNIEREHLDYWQTEEHMIEGFQALMHTVTERSLLFYCIDDPILSTLTPQGISYGESEGAMLKLTNWSMDASGSTFSLSFEKKVLTDLFVPLLGKYNVLNALATVGMVLRLGVSEDKIRKGLKAFRGMKRRLERKGEVNGITFFDDYAHHPTEIEATLTALKKAIGKKRVVAIFQPHRYSRTADLMDRFTHSFQSADVTIITDIFTAGENPLPGITGQALFQKIDVREGAFIEKTALLNKLFSLIKPGDVVVTLGAGDITGIGPKLIESLL